MRTLAFLGMAALIAAPLTSAAADPTAPGSARRFNWGSPHAPGQGGGQQMHRSPGSWHAGRPPVTGGLHRGGQWRGERGMTHRGTHMRFARGQFLPRFWVSPTFFVPHWNRFGFGAPGYGQNWVRYYDDAMLVDGSGRIYDSVYDVDWDKYDHGPVPSYDGRGPEDDLFYGDDGVTWGGRYAAPYPSAPYTLPYPAAGQTKVYHVPYGATVVISAPVVTTHTKTTTYVEKVRAKPRPQRSWKSKARPGARRVSSK